jgi:hypothetical protein
LTNLPFDTINLSGDDVQILEDTYDALKAKFNIDIDCNIHFDIKKFDLTADTDMTVTTIGGLLSITSPNQFCLVFLKTRYSGCARGQSRTYWFKYSAWAYINQTKDFGRVLIRRETFNDRLVALLHPCEMKFEDDKPFDHKFYVVTNDDQKAHLAMSWNFRNAVMDMGDNMVLETEGKSLIVGSHSNINLEETIQLAEFASKIAALK